MKATLWKYETLEGDAIKRRTQLVPEAGELLSMCVSRGG